jgi:hypothetical protein
MMVCQNNQSADVVPFRKRSDVNRVAVSPRNDGITCVLDLSKYQHPRPEVENRNANMRVNIAAIMFLGLLVFAAKEDFCKLERSNLCLTRSDCLH